MDNFQKRLFIFNYCDTETYVKLKYAVEYSIRLTITIFLLKAFNISGFDQHYLKYSHDRNFKADVHVPCN